MNCLISGAHGPEASPTGAAGAGGGGGGGGCEEAAGWEESLDPLNIPVRACPATWPTAEPTATLPAVAAICSSKIVIRIEKKSHTDYYDMIRYE